MERQVTTEQRTNEAQVEGFGLQVSIPETPTDVVPLNCQAAFASFTEAEKQEILSLADSIDVTKIENVMAYGSVALKSTFDQCGEFLKDERGSEADQKVIAQVIELSKKASSSYEDFNLVLKEPNLFQKMFLKILSGGNNAHTEKIKNSAVTNYKLLAELKESCESWLDMLRQAMDTIEYSALSDMENISLLEKYIIAGNIAKQRIENDLDKVQNEYKETGLQKYEQQYKKLTEGYDLFNITMTNLERSRVLYHLSIGQLSLIKKSNRNVQITIHTQVDNSMALIGQQLRNAVLNAKTREVLEGQKAISRLSDELIKDVSKKVGLTAEETEKLIYAGFYSMDAAKEAITTVIKSCEAIEKTASEMLPKMKADMTEINELIKELEPCIGTSETLKIESTSSTKGAQLKF